MVARKSEKHRKKNAKDKKKKQGSMQIELHNVLGYATAPLGLT